MKLRIFNKYIMDWESLKFVTEFAQLCEFNKYDETVQRKAQYN